MKGIRWKTVEYGDDRLDWFFFFLCRIKEKGKDGESRGREKEGFLSPLISVDATVIVEKESNFYYRE